MATEAVKKQILVAIGALNLPLDRVLSSRKLSEACSAAKLLRNRLLREHSRVTEYIETLRQKQLFEEQSDDDVDYDLASDERLSKQSAERAEYTFLSEMMVAEKVVIPLLLAHGMNYSETLLPQLLKLLAALLLPIPRFSTDETHQQDLLQRTRLRCGSDEFFALLVQCIAPVAEKRSRGSLQREDVVLLEVVLTLITRLLDGPSTEVENVIGAFCRNHGIELLLVVINQNYSKTIRSEEEEEGNTHDVEPREGDENNGTAMTNDAEVVNASPAAVSTTQNGQVFAAEGGAEEAEVELSDDDGEDEEGDRFDDNEDYAREAPLIEAVTEVDRQFQQRVHELLESEDQLWKWNCLAMAAIASVFQCTSANELAQLSFVNQTTHASPEQLLGLLRKKSQFKECKREADNWRFIARSRNGAMTSNGIVVRADMNRQGVGLAGRTLGTVSSLLGARRKDPLEVVKDMDVRKRGRFIKGMFQDSTPRCDLPIPTKIQLSQQSQAFLTLGFEPLSTMTWSKLQQTILRVEQATKEFKELLSGYRGTGERMEISSPFDTAAYDAFSVVVGFMVICRSLLQYIREVARLMKQDNIPFTSPSFQQQWRSVSSVLSLDHLQYGFSVLRSFLLSRDLRRRVDIVNVVGYLAELLLVLNLLLEGEVIRDPAVEVAAHALASSVLYNEENIKTVFDLLAEYSSRVIPVAKAQVLTLFVFSVFQLMDKCSYKGSLLLPKRPKQKRNKIDTEVVGADGHDDDDDDESVNSAKLEEMNDELVASMVDMIDDGDTSVQRPEGSGHAAAQENTDEPLQKATEPTSQVPDEADALGDSESEHFRASSEIHPPSEVSMASSGRTALSTISSEREVAVKSYLRRLATPKNAGLLYSTLRHWRINDADVNLGLTYLMEMLVEDGCESVFFNVAFLLLMREVMTYGKKTHAPLYNVCDRIVYNFFNPGFARTLDENIASQLGPNERGVLLGAQSFVGFEVALRCGRSLFTFGATDYAILEEKGMPHLTGYTAIDLPGEAPLAPFQLDEEEDPDENHDTSTRYEAEDDGPAEQNKKRRRHRKRKRDDAVGETTTPAPPLQELLANEESLQVVL